MELHLFLATISQVPNSTEKISTEKTINNKLIKIKKTENAKIIQIICLSKKFTAPSTGVNDFIVKRPANKSGTIKKN